MKMCANMVRKINGELSMLAAHLQGAVRLGQTWTNLIQVMDTVLSAYHGGNLYGFAY